MDILIASKHQVMITTGKRRLNLLKMALKDELKGFGITVETINEMIQDGRIDIEKIEMPSFHYFSERLKSLL